LAFTTSICQPGFGIGLTPTTPSGIRMRTFKVGEFPQPWGTLNVAL